MELSTKPYFLRAIYEWCVDSGFTPYLSVKVDATTRVPMEHVKNGEIVLNVSAQATRNLTMSNDLIQFSARFNGASRELSIPVGRVAGIFARENGQGAFFPIEEVELQPSKGVSQPALPRQPLSVQATEPQEAAETQPKRHPDGPGRPRLTVIK